MIILSKKNGIIGIAILLLGGWITLDRSQSSPLIINALPSSPPTQNMTTHHTPATGWVHIAGEVYHPGVYQVPIGTRTLDALKLAGGVTPDGDLNRIKLAKPIKDGDTIWIKRKKHTTASTHSPQKPIAINHAPIDILTQIKGIGPKMAERIVQNRPYHGPKDLLKVRGIGEKSLQKWRHTIRFDP